MTFQELLNAQNICFLKSTQKKDAFEELFQTLSGIGPITDLKKLKEDLLTRENLMSTGLGQNVAVPHVRSKYVLSPVLLIGISRSGISDYASSDALPVHLIFLIAVSESQHVEYFYLVSGLIRKIRAKPITHALRNAATVEAALSLLREW
jgi:mannitol/fructose-specific phosphotransferase system IIA component (Ntr-type)